jgi:hypothetical protein
MRDTARRYVLFLTAVASVLLGGAAGYALCAARSAPLSTLGPTPERAERARQAATPQEALTVAFKALPSLARFTLFDSYRIQMTRVKDQKAWGVRFFPLPEVPDSDEYITVKDDGTTEP